jgi:itaconate CoA-transferase
MASVAAPLSGITVVAVEQAVAMPFCTARLADAGARVLKVERPEGDFARGYDQAAAGQSSYFVWLNRGKESVRLDLIASSDRERLHALIDGADVFVSNLKPGAIDKLGLSADILRARRPELICCSISGYGESGPLALRKAYDLLVQAESGLASLTGSPDAPARVGISVVDIATGATAHAAILEALLARRSGGGGATISVSMFDVIAEWLSVPLLHAENGNAPGRVGLSHPSIAPYGGFRAADGKVILISIQNDREWETLCTQILQRRELVNDPMFRANVDRVRNREKTDRAVAEGFVRQSSIELISCLERHGIAFAEVNDMNDLLRHPHLRRISVDTPAGTVHLPAPAPIFRNVVRGYGRVPDIDEHLPLPEG